MENEIIKLSIRKDCRLIPQIASFIANTASTLNLSKRKTYYLCFVLEAALELRMKDIDDDSTITLSVVDNGKYFKFSLIDFGKPYILTKNQQEILKRKIVDRYSFQQNGRKGQCFSMSYYYDYVPTNEIVVEKETLLDEDFSFRKVRKDDEDILSAIKCLYACYGFEYYHQNLYSVESFKKYIKSGRYIPIIGENSHKQKMCYCALDENVWFEGIPELANLVTNPIARGKGLASKIISQAQNIAIKEGYEGIHVSAVGYHPYTQRMCNQLGYSPSAIEYSINPAGTGGYSKDHRLDCVIAIKVFNKTKKHDLYVDKQCNEVVSSIFDLEELNYQIHNETVTNEIESSEIEYVIDADTANCFIKIDICGKDFASEIKEIINKEEVMNMDVITINLNANDENAIQGYNILRNMNFIFGGLILGARNGDFLLLQSFKVEPMYDQIVLEDNYKQLQMKLDKVNKM